MDGVHFRAREGGPAPNGPNGVSAAVSRDPRVIVSMAAGVSAWPRELRLARVGVMSAKTTTAATFRSGDSPDFSSPVQVFCIRLSGPVLRASNGADVGVSSAIRRVMTRPIAGAISVMASAAGPVRVRPILA